MIVVDQFIEKSVFGVCIHAIKHNVPRQDAIFVSAVSQNQPRRVE